MSPIVHRRYVLRNATGIKNEVNISRAWKSRVSFVVELDISCMERALSIRYSEILDRSHCLIIDIPCVAEDVDARCSSGEIRF